MRVDELAPIRQRTPVFPAKQYEKADDDRFYPQGEPDDLPDNV